MSSNPPAERNGRPWTLRARLLASTLGLLAVMCMVIGVVTAVFVSDFLTGQLDDRLRAAATRLQGPVGNHRPGAYQDQTDPDRDVGPGPDNLYVPGQAEGTLAALISGDDVDAGVLVTTEPGLTGGTTIPTSALQTLRDIPANGKPYTRDLGEELEDYRLVARYTPEGRVLVTGLPLSTVRETTRNLLLIGAAVAGVGLIVAAVIGSLIVRRALRPLSRVAATATRVSELRLDRGEVALSERVPDTDPRTEVGQVGAAINRMLGHVGAALSARHASEMRVRQFVADASHELRTPLAAIRGYAELTRRVDAEVPRDVVHAMGRVESEATRMTALVDDLLLLARLDSAKLEDTGRPLDYEPVDLSRIVVDAVGDAHAAGPGHRWRLDLPEDEVYVSGDAARLHQVLANLLANARTHTPSGTTVEVGLSTSDGQVQLTVMDNGPGIPAALQPEVFERFARGDTSRSRAAGSTGLGLAIVAAVVEAHDGTVEVQSRPGRTAFTVTLPTAAEPISQPAQRKALPAAQPAPPR